MMIKTNMKYPTACFWEDFCEYFPPPYDEMTLPQFILRCKAGKAPQFWKALSQKNRPQWTRASLSQWWLSTFGETNPESYKALLASGFPVPTVPPPDRPALRPRKPKGNPHKRRAPLPMRESERTPPNTVMQPQPTNNKKGRPND